MVQRIGGNGIGGFTNGDIWDFRVHNTELTPTEIANLVQNPTYLTGHEVGIWHNDEEAGTTAFDSVSQDNLLPSYESDFSVDTGVWAASLGAKSVTSDGTSLIFTMDSSTASHRCSGGFTGLPIFIVGRNLTISYDYFIPSTNNIIDGFGVRDEAVAWYKTAETKTLDTWVTES